MHIPLVLYLLTTERVTASQPFTIPVLTLGVPVWELRYEKYGDDTTEFIVPIPDPNLRSGREARELEELGFKRVDILLL